MGTGLYTWRNVLSEESFCRHEPVGFGVENYVRPLYSTSVWIHRRIAFVDENSFAGIPEMSKNGF